MYATFQNMSDRTKLLAPVALCALALLAVSLLNWSALERVKVGGPADAEIQSGKDLMADVLPPPMYLVEAHLAVQEAAGLGDPKRAAEFAEKYAALRKEYDERQAHWVKVLPPGPTRDLVAGPLHAAAREYFAVCDQQLIPALRAGDAAKARELANGVLKDKYRAQRAVVDEVVRLTEAENKAKLDDAASVVRTNTRLAAALGVALTLGSVVLAVFIVRRVTGAAQLALARAQESEGIVATITRVQAMIEFKLDGTVVTANEVFLAALGYALPEIQGRHHSTFIEPALAGAPEYREFWAKLNRGEFVAGEFKRIGKGGKEVWIQASYNPVLDPSGKPYKVVKFATDVTAAKVLELRVKENAERDAATQADLKHRVDTILTAVDALVAGDFTYQLPPLGDDPVGHIAVALNKAITSVRTALEGVREVSEQLADASGQLAAASEEISTGAQEQASSLEETASTLEEITSTVRQSADNAQQARQLASGSKDVAEKGGSVVSHAVEAMSEINASSKRIAEIITAIDEIAFQTNLLALNAAVEAARAGEQGRGFAVVAAEVRNLAQRSATAAKEIKSLINDSVKKVDAGTDLVNRSGATLAEIVTSVKRVTDIVTEMAAASKEQASGIEQVNKAVSQMDTVTQRNASQTEEMSATAQTLTDQAGQLRDLVARFKLGGDADRAPARPAPKTKPATKPRPAVARALMNGHSNGNGNGNGHAHELDSLGGSDDGFTEF